MESVSCLNPTFARAKQGSRPLSHSPFTHSGTKWFKRVQFSKVTLMADNRLKLTLSNKVAGNKDNMFKLSWFLASKVIMQPHITRHNKLVIVLYLPFFVHCVLHSELLAGKYWFQIPPPPPPVERRRSQLETSQKPSKALMHNNNFKSYLDPFRVPSELNSLPSPLSVFFGSVNREVWLIRCGSRRPRRQPVSNSI